MLVRVRSSRNPSLDAMAQSLESLFRMAGAEHHPHPRLSRLAAAAGSAAAASAFCGFTKSKPAIICPCKRCTPASSAAFWRASCRGLDAVSFGPDIRGAHSPDERVSVPSVARTYELLKTLLADLAGGG